MKKIIFSFMALATMALTFTACEDVPEPYGLPVAEDNGSGSGGEELQLTSAGTATSPYIVTDIIAVAKRMTADETKSGVYVKGIVSQIDEIDTGTYGNATYYISIDGTSANQFEIYRGYYLDGAKFTSEDQLKVGDVVVVYGDLVNFKGNTPELTQRNKLISINDPNVNPAVGDGTEGGDDQPTGEGAEGSGTADSPYNVAAILQVGSKLTSDDQVENVYVKGIISQIDDVSTQYGNATYYISDDGQTTTQFEIYRGYYIDGAKFTAEDQIKVGDKVTVCGTLVNFKGNTLEFTTGSKIISINDETPVTPDQPGEATGEGTQESPFNAAKANAVAGALASQEVSSQSYYIKGKVCAIATDKNGNAQNYDYGTYGNASFYISDDGTETGKFYVYRALYLGNKKWEQGAGDVLKVGDEVVIYGKLTNYNGTPETAQGEAYLYSLNGKTEGETPDTPEQPTGDATGNGTAESPYNVVAILQEGAKLTANDQLADVYVKGIISKIDEVNTQYGNATYYISDDGQQTTQFEIYRGYYLDGEKFTAASQLKLGAEVVICGTLVNFKGNTIEFTTGSKIISITGGEDNPDTPDQPTGDGLGTLDGNTLTVAAPNFGAANGTALGSYTLAGGATISFDGGGNTNAPKFYSAGNGTVRMYPKNSMAINAGSKTIAEIKLVCNNYQNQLYNASGDVKAGEVSPTIDGDNLIFTGVNASSVTVSNISETTGAASQVRWEQLIITFAE